jgi:uncharacterized protein
MFWLMTCQHKPGCDAERDIARPAHRAYVASGGDGLVRVLIGAPLTEDDGETATGNFGILEAPSRAVAQAFAEGDPYAKAGIVEEITIVALASRFQAERIRPMSP